MQHTGQHYMSIWKHFVLHGAVLQEDSVPPSLLQSWRRCAASGIDAYGEIALIDTVSTADVTSMTGIYAVHAPHPTQLALVRPAMEDLYQFTEGSACIVAFADANARIVDIVGDSTIQELFDHLGVRIGYVWSEEVQGSNALALALQESFPIQLDGAMHYRAALHEIYTSASPVYDMLGQLIGVLAVIGKHEQCHPHTLGMVTAAAQAISNQLQMQVWLSNANDLLSELRTILQSLPEGILLLRRDGVISQMNAPAGTMLGLTPGKATGRRIHDVLPLPALLAQALATQQALSDEELVFDTSHGRVTCLCTLKALPVTLPATSEWNDSGSPLAMSSAQPWLSESSSADGFIVILRSIERVQKLVHRMTGTYARLTFEHVIGNSLVLQEVMRLARLASRSNATVLLHGETGTGKEIFAQSIHNNSARADKPFVAINCAAIPRELINTELFGYEGGTFTGADRQGRSGKFEQAHGGTLFLDEIGDMPLDLQTSLLRAIETRTIVRIGGQRVIAADVRIIVATHKDLREEVRRGNFRSDLYYRLNVLSITIPPLRERVDDVPVLVHYFLQRQSRVLGRPFTITSEAMQVLSQGSWPGNVRELENMLERITYLTPRATITVDDLPQELLASSHHATHAIQPEREPFSAQSTPFTPSTPPESAMPSHGIAEKKTILREQSSTAEIQAIMDAWRISDGHLTRTAALLGINRTTLWRKMVKYGLTNIKSKR